MDEAAIPPVQKNPEIADQGVAQEVKEGAELQARELVDADAAPAPAPPAPQNNREEELERILEEVFGHLRNRNREESSPPRQNRPNVPRGRNAVPRIPGSAPRVNVSRGRAKRVNTRVARKRPQKK
ncbi:hypothetical protein GCK72_025926 [Caenorhabditis remanei]|uniref:Uncharacterized protein n=1 Tax=Caenorhabditis remanei TaxID=31234 RepID=A0A6A5G391_CAERE|nr:hypothetical protein GCK72_025926 [Caenorhabditis remanei]KAF1749458.1 hypothetical protein GCK72_025926 [Caenorhabditis remanei]